MSLEALNQLIPEEELTLEAPEEPAVSSLEKLNSLIPDSAPAGVTGEKLTVPETEGSKTATRIKSAQPAFQMVGALVGGAVGGAGAAVSTLGAGTPVGVATGAALGTMAGEFAFQTVEGLARNAGVEGLGESPSFSERITKAGKEGVIDLGFTVGSKAVGDVAKLGFKHLMPKETQDLIKEADKLGIDPNKMTIHSTKLQKFYAAVVGRFPFASGKFRTRSKESVKQLGNAKQNLFMRMGPSWDMAKVGIKLDDAYKTQFKTFRKELNKRYTALLTEAKRVNANVDTSAIKEEATEAISRMRLALQATGKSDDEVIKAMRTDPVLKRLLRYVNVKDTLTLDELRAVDELLDKDLAFAGSRGGESIAQFGKIKDSFQKAKKSLRQVLPPEEGGKTVKEMLHEADRLFTETMTEMFETPVAKKVQRVTKNAFSVGKFSKAGTRNPDESFKMLWNAKSPQGLEDLHRVVGDKRFSASLRTHVDNIYDRSVQKGIDDFMSGQNKLAFDFTGFKNSLGIGNPKSIEYSTTKKALELSKSGVTMENLTSFMALLENALRNSPDDVNTFIARRATLGGTHAVSGLIGSLGGVGTLFLSRGIGRILSGKPLLARASMMLDPNISLQHRKALALSFEKMFENQEQ